MEEGEIPMERCPENPIITRKHIPAISPRLRDVTSVFNPGAVMMGDRHVLMLRVQSRARETFFLVAESRDGVNFSVRDEIVAFGGIGMIGEKIYHAYDARITFLEGSFFIMFAMDMDDGCRLGLAGTPDFDRYDFLGIVSREDCRNGVLFPEKIGGRYLRLDRPNTMLIGRGPSTGTAIWLSESDDLLTWRPGCPVMTGRWHYWDELIGSGPPPVKTREGWLHIYHGVATHFASANIYQAGVVLLDLHDPSKVLARSHENILEPRESYELVGQVPNVVFPSGMIVGQYDEDGYAAEESPVRIYYGAADTCIALATTTIRELLDMAYGGER